MMFNIGDAARYFADKSDDEVIANAMQALQNMYGENNVPKQINYARSNWSKD